MEQISNNYPFLDIPDASMFSRLQEIPSTLFLSNLEILTLVVHLFFWITFHKESPWWVQILFAVPTILLLRHVLQGPRRQPFLLQESQFMNFSDFVHLVMNTIPFSRMLYSLPMCMLLGITEPDLCNPHMYSTYQMRSFLDDEEASQSIPVISGKSIVLAHHRPGFDIPKLFRFVQAKQGSYRIIISEGGTRFRAYVLNSFNRWLFNGRMLPRDVRMKIKNNEANIDDRYSSLFQFVQMVLHDDNIPTIILPDKESALYADDTSFFYRIGGLVCAQALGIPLYDFQDGWPSFVGGPCSRTRTQMTAQSYEDLLKIWPVPKLKEAPNVHDFIEWYTTHRYRIGQVNQEIETQHKQFLQNHALQCGQCFSDPIGNQCKKPMNQRDELSRIHNMCSG